MIVNHDARRADAPRGSKIRLLARFVYLLHDLIIVITTAIVIATIIVYYCCRY